MIITFAAPIPIAVCATRFPISTDVENKEKENENWKRGLQEMSPLQIAQSAFEKIYQVEMPAELTGLFQEAYLAATHKEEEEEE